MDKPVRICELSDWMMNEKDISILMEYYNEKKAG